MDVPVDQTDRSRKYSLLRDRVNVIADRYADTEKYLQDSIAAFENLSTVEKIIVSNYLLRMMIAALHLSGWNYAPDPYDVKTLSERDRFYRYTEDLNIIIRYTSIKRNIWLKIYNLYINMGLSWLCYILSLEE